MAGAGSGAGAKKGTKVEPGPKIYNFGSATLPRCLLFCPEQSIPG